MRTRACKKCGKIFEKKDGSTAYLCPDCAKQAKRDSVIRERTCKLCGALFMGYPRSFYCPDCSAERKKEQKKIYNKRKPARPLGSLDVCEACGKEYVVKSGLQRYCPECSEIKVAEKIRSHKIEYREKNKERYEEAKRATQGKRYICKVCGKEFEKHTPTVTCSEECRKELLRRNRNRADINRGRRKLPVEQKFESGLPKSGITGITWKSNNQKWQVNYKKTMSASTKL